MASPEPLRGTELFARFDDETLERIARPFHEVELPAEQVVIEPRQTGSGLYFICDGTVEVEAHDVRRELGAGELVGEISLVEDDHTRRARVTTKTPVRLLALNRSDFDELVNDVPELGQALRELARRRLADLQS